MNLPVPFIRLYQAAAQTNFEDEARKPFMFAARLRIVVDVYEPLPSSAVSTICAFLLPDIGALYERIAGQLHRIRSTTGGIGNDSTRPRPSTIHPKTMPHTNSSLRFRPGPARELPSWRPAGSPRQYHLTQR